MASPRVYGPYKARKGYRMVVVEGGARKSLIVPSVAAAETLRADLERELRESSRGDRTIAAALAEYQDYLLRVRGAATAQHIARALERFLDGTRTLGALTAARAASLYEAETRRVLTTKNRPVAAASHRTVLGQCKRFYAWAVERGYTADNPFAAVKPVGKPKVGKAQLRIDEARRFTALALDKARRGDRAATCALLALMLGMRASEVLCRTVRDLDDGGRVLWIPRGKTDNARRRLEVPEVLRPILRDLATDRRPEALLLGPDPGDDGRQNRPPTDAWLWGHVQKLCDEAGVPRVSTHSLRGLHSTLALEAGATSGAVAAALGHGSFQITAKHYAAPGTIERVRSKAVAQTLQAPSPAAPDLLDADPGELRRALQRLPAHLRAEIQRALSDSKE